MTHPSICRGCLVGGLVLSALAHLPIAALLLQPAPPQPSGDGLGGGSPVAVTLAMFAAEPPAVGAAIGGQDDLQQASAEPEPEPEPKPEPEKEPEPEPRPQQRADQSTPPDQAPIADPRQSETASASDPESEPRPKPEAETAAAAPAEAAKLATGIPALSAATPALLPSSTETPPPADPKETSTARKPPAKATTTPALKQKTATPAPKPRKPRASKPRSKQKSDKRQKKKKRSSKPTAKQRSGEAKSGSQAAGTAANRSSANAGGGKQGGASTRKSKAAEGAYLNGLRGAIGRKRFYPPAARRRGLEGVVTVYFVLTADGSITKARIAKSSGHAALDKAALKTLARLGRYKPIPKKIGRVRWPLKVPISFTLQ